VRADDERAGMRDAVESRAPLVFTRSPFLCRNPDSLRSLFVERRVRFFCGVFVFQIFSLRATSRPRRVAFPVSQLTAAISLSMVASSAFAQTKVEPVVVTASRTAEALTETLRDVSVVRGDELERAGVNDLVVALQSVAGVEVVAQGAGATPSIFVRGGNSNQLLVLVDGQRVGSAFNGLSALQHIPIAQIDRIEIVRGPAASLYGADAVSGVIQIFTKRDKGLSANAMFGEQRSSDVSARAGFASGGSAFSVSANHRESHGYNAIVDPQNFSYNPDRDGYRFTSAQASGAFAISPKLSLEGSALVARGNVQYDGGADFDDRINSDIRNLGAKLNFKASDAWTSTLSVGQGVDKSEFLSSFPGTYKTTQDQASWQNNWRVNRDTVLWGALEWRREKIAALDEFAIDSRRTTSFAFGGDTTWNALKASASLRVDDSSQYDTRTTGNVGLAYALSREWRVLANAGTSFKAPTFNDLYFPGFSNPLLAPEKAKNVELAIAWSRGASNAKALVYDNRVRDLIQFICDANFNCAPQNVAKADLRGATFSAATRIASWNVEGSLDLADPKDANTDKRLARRAKVHGAMKFSGDLFGVTSGIEVIASGDRFDNPSNAKRIAGYGIVNFFARYEVTRGVAVGLRVDNAFDRDYQLASGYATGGRRGWITFNLSQQ
jgi:vitamin B12 transporter